MLENNLKQVLEQIKNGNNLGEKITLVGATKMVDVDTINKAITMGLSVVAENKVQEFNQKTTRIVGAEQHFIGHLQTNKVKYLVGKVKIIQSVDSIKLAEEIDKYAEKRQIIQDVLIEINVGGELSKSGFDFSCAKDGVYKISNLCRYVRIVGLMAMLPHTDDVDILALLTRKMRELYEQLKNEGLPFQYLSVGMSHDYNIAIQNGSNMIRLGRTIFGERNYGEKTNGNI